MSRFVPADNVAFRIPFPNPWTTKRLAVARVKLRMSYPHYSALFAKELEISSGMTPEAVYSPGRHFGDVPEEKRELMIGPEGQSGWHPATEWEFLAFLNKHQLDLVGFIAPLHTA